MNGPMLNAYPDSIGGTLKDVLDVLELPEFAQTFDSFYILPSIFNTDLDRGFSVIDYGLNEQLASEDDLKRLEALGISLKLDFILNHASVLSKEFQDIIRNGEQSEYKDFFINWNTFWEGCGEMGPDGYIIPEERYTKQMFFRKPGLPILMVRFPDGTEVPYWNTFYQEVIYRKVDEQDLMADGGMQYLTAQKLAASINAQIDAGVAPKEMDFTGFEQYRDRCVEFLESNRRYLGQMDLNIKSPLVWKHYERTLRQLAEYGAKIVRLDAFAYAPKEPGEKNFLNEPGTWELLEKLQKLADRYEVSLLPEIHASYAEKTYELLSKKGYMTYDFFLPGLMIYAIDHHDGEVLVRWAKELIEKQIRTVSMLGCHDGIPLLDLKGFLAEEQIQELIDVIVSRGGYVKDLHGQKNVYYQVNATYYSALGEDDKKMLFARALQMFMPGKPQVWYLDLFAGKNDHAAVERAGAGGHKEINRTNLDLAQIKERLSDEVVTEQLRLLRLRNTSKAFGFDAKLSIEQEGTVVRFCWENEGARAVLRADFADYSYEVSEETL